MAESGNQGRFKNPVEAVLVGTKELIRVKPNTRPINDNDRLDGKVCLITGANSGVGWGVAKLWAERGATLIMACRTLVPDKAAELRELTGNPNIHLYEFDLGSFDKIDAFVDALRRDGIRLDVSLFNAGLGAAVAKKTEYGLEELFQVNYLAKFYLVNRLLAEGVIPNSALAGNKSPGDPVHRLMFTSSDSHRGAQPVNTETLGVFYEYGARGGIANYSYYKLVLNTFAMELSRRLNREGEAADVSVFPICPGPVNTNIIRNAPPVLKAILGAIFAVGFQHPDKAAPPFLYLATANEVEGKTGLYLHMKTEKPMDEKCYEDTAGAALWDRSMTLLESIGRSVKPLSRTSA
ncbi:MAG: SDR family NAD(P)-dependent oxidoreductase [Pseudomonadota bacterium]